jgi:hypothetical protein
MSRITSVRGAPMSPEQRLRAVLDAARLRYEMHATRAGSPYAGFRLAAAGDAPIGMTAMLRGPVLQLGAHALRAGVAEERDMRAADAFTQEWRLGRLYHHTERASWEAATSVYCGDGEAAAAALEHALSDIQTVARLARSGAAFAPRLSEQVLDDLATSRLRVPRAPVAVSLLDVETALSAAGIRYRLVDGAQRVTLRLAEPGGVETLVELSKTDERFLHLRAQHDADEPADDAALLARLQRLNAGLLIGAMVLTADPPRMRHHAMLPLAWISVDGRLVHWLLDHATAALTAS